MDLGHADARGGPALLGPLPPRLAARPLPRGHRAEGGGRRRGGRPAAGLPVAGPEGRTARGGRTRSSTAARSGRPSSSTRSRCRSCSHGGWAARARPTGRTSAGRRLPRRTTDRRAATRSAGRTRTATRPNTIATEIAGLICAADIARRNGAAGKAAAYEALADDWQAKVESWTATTNGPYSPRPYYLRVTKDGDARRRHAPTTWATTSTAPVDQREIVDNSFLGLVLFGVKTVERPDDPQLADGRRPDERRIRCGRRRRAGRSGTGSRSTATASRPTATTGTCSSTTRRARRAGACGRC